VNLDPVRAAAGGVLPPQLIDEPLGGDGLASVKDQQCQQRTATSRRQVDRSSLVQGLHRPQDPELHPRLSAGQIGP
jgi:hypothetical protein